MTDEPLEVCEEHGTPVQRVFHPVAVHFKGSGFYNTDYGKKSKSGAAAEGKSDSGPWRANVTRTSVVPVCGRVVRLRGNSALLY